MRYLTETMQKFTFTKESRNHISALVCDAPTATDVDAWMKIENEMVYIVSVFNLQHFPEIRLCYHRDHNRPIV